MDKKSLTEVVLHHAELTQAIIEAGGELDPELEQRLLTFDLTRAETIDRCEHASARLEAEAALWAEKAKAFQAIARTLGKARERLRQRVKDALSFMDVTEVCGNDFRFKMVRGADQLVIHEEMLPAECMMAVQTMVPDKEKIRDLLTAGQVVPGAVMAPVMSLRTYVSKGKL